MSKKISEPCVLSFPVVSKLQQNPSNLQEKSSASPTPHPSSNPKPETHLIDTTELEQIAQRLRNTDLPLKTQNLIQRYIYELKTFGQ